MAFIEGKPQQNFGDLLGQQLKTGLSTMAQMKLQNMQQRQQRSQEQSTLEQGLKQLPGAKPEWAQFLMAIPAEKRVEGLRELMRTQPAEQGGQPTGQIGQTQAVPGIQSPADEIANKYANAPARKHFETPQETMAREAETGKERRHAQDISLREQELIDKETEEGYKNTVHAYKAAQTQKMELARLRELNRAGKLPSGGKWALMKKVGLDIPALLSADAQEFEKISTGFMKNMKDMFGARILQTEVDNFLKTIPSLMQTPEGRERVISNMESIADAAKIRFDIMRELKKENGGRRPRDMEELIEERASKQLDELAEQFKGGYGRKKAQTEAGSLGGQPNEPNQSMQEQPQEPYDASKEDIVDQMARYAVSVGSRVLPQMATGTGNVGQLAANVADYAASKVGKFTGNKELEEQGMGAGEAFEKYNPLPTSESVEKRFSKWSKGYTDPQGPIEKFGYDIAETVASFLMPETAVGKVAGWINKAGLIGKSAKIAQKIILPFSGYAGSTKKLIASVAAGKTLKAAANTISDDPLIGLAAETAGFLLTGTAGTRGKLKADAGKIIENAKSGFGSSKMDATPEIRKLSALKNEALKSGHGYKDKIVKTIDGFIDGIKMSKGTKTETQVINKLSGATKKTKTNIHNHPVNSLVEAAQNANDMYGWSVYERVPGGNFTPVEMRPYLGKIIDIMDQGVARSAKKNPALGVHANQYIVGKDIWKGLHTHDAATQWLIDNAELMDRGEGAKFIWNMIKGGGSFLGRDAMKVQSLLRHEAGQKAYLEALDGASLGSASKFKSGYGKLKQIYKHVIGGE
jgi:hypothetical protein